GWLEFHERVRSCGENLRPGMAVRVGDRRIRDGIKERPRYAANWPGRTWSCTGREVLACGEKPRRSWNRPEGKGRKLPSRAASGLSIREEGTLHPDRLVWRCRSGTARLVLASVLAAPA